MAGTVFKKILSRSKILSTSGKTSQGTTESANSSCRTADMNTVQYTPKITFEERPLKPNNEMSPSLDGNVQESPTSSFRKHSYASVREEDELPQSFRTRRLRSSRESLSSADMTSRRPSVDSTNSDYSYEWAAEQEECAVVDDSSTGSILLDQISISQRTAPIEGLPDEILDMIFSLLTLDRAPDDYVRSQADLFSCLLVSKPIYAAALRVVYRHVSISKSKTFHKFMTSLVERPMLGEMVQHLDFSHYSSLGFGRTKDQTTQTPYLTPQTLEQCLTKTTNLRGFLVHEHVDEELSAPVMSKLFQMHNLKVLDLTGCGSRGFVEAFTSACDLMTLPQQFSGIRCLSLHECTTLKSRVFETLLPRLGLLTHLDLAHTSVNDKALASIPHIARITHLNLERCTQVTGQGVVDFVTSHPAIKNTAVYLNLMADASRHRLLSEGDVSRLLPALPSTLRSLNVGGARVDSRHTGDLTRLATHLEELGLKGANLGSSDDIARVLSLPSSATNLISEGSTVKSSLRYIDLTDVRSVNQMSLTYTPMAITSVQTLPLEVIELGSPVITEINRRNKNVKNPDWVVKELGRRGWYVRQPASLPKGQSLDHGSRAWKMGVRWWGMRKIPVLEQEVGGMYGYFMFKRN